MKNSRGNPSNNDKRLSKQTNINSHKVNISISIALDLLTLIENLVEGTNRSEKVVKCIKMGIAKETPP